MEKEFPKRKAVRLDKYDYSKAGAYFLTICTKDKKPMLSTISVGDGALDAPKTQLTRIGEIVEKYILSTNKIKNVSVKHYVIMPNHIHLIILIKPTIKENIEDVDNIGTSKAPSPTNEMIPHIVSTFKRFCNKEIGDNIFQRTYYDHIIRDKEDYETRARYIYENPKRWFYDELYKE